MRHRTSHQQILTWFKDDIFRRLFVNAGKLLSANAVATVLGLATTILTARALGPKNYGILALVLVYGLTIGKLVTFNAWQAIIKFGTQALQADDEPSLRQLIKLGFSLDIASALLGTVLAMVLSGPMIALIRWDQNIRPLLILYSILIIFSISGTPVGVLRLFDRFDLLSYTAILSAVVKLAGVLWCFMTGQGLFGFVLVYLITGIVGKLYQVFASLWVLKMQGISHFMQQPLRGIRVKFPGIWDYVWTSNLNSTIRMLSREADGLIIAGLTTPSVLGLFKIAKQFSRPLLILIDPLYQSIYPELSRLWSSGNSIGFLSMIKRSTFFVGIVAVVSWLLFLLCGKWLIVGTVGSNYEGAYTVAVIYLLAIVIAICGFSLQPAMLALGLPRNSFKAQVIATILYLLMLFPFVHFLGISGAALSYVVYYIIWTLIMLSYVLPTWIEK